MRWLLLQLADSAFPTGGFAHSSGLEAAAQLGEVGTAADLALFVDDALAQAGNLALPFIGAAHDAPARLAELDAACDALLTSHVANRASRTQGRAFAATCARVFDAPPAGPLAALDDACRTRRVHAHLAPVLGAATRALGVSRDDALALHLHATLRGLSSAAVRLGLTGPHEAQRLVHERAATLDRVLAAGRDLAPGDAHQTAPLLEIFGMAHDRLYSRLFQS
jgi:urease accessory protein